MPFGRNLYQPWEKATVTAATTEREVVNVAGRSDWVIQWLAPITGLDDAVIKVYSSPLEWGDKLLDDLNPATNGWWRLEPGAVFTTNPGKLLLSDSITLSESAFGVLLIEVVATNQLNDFTIAVRGQRRS